MWHGPLGAANLCQRQQWLTAAAGPAPVSDASGSSACVHTHVRTQLIGLPSVLALSTARSKHPGGNQDVVNIKKATDMTTYSPSLPPTMHRHRVFPLSELINYHACYLANSVIDNMSLQLKCHYNINLKC